LNTNDSPTLNEKKMRNTVKKEGITSINPLIDDTSSAEQYNNNNNNNGGFSSP
jgi:hypothetical protein